MYTYVKELWTDALRSGRFHQGHGRLSKDGRFCCLGVLCELAVEAGVIERYPDGDLLGSTGYRVPGNCIIDYHILPDAVIRWAGLSDNDDPRNPVVTDAGSGIKTNLSVFNDGDPTNGIPSHDFSQIPDLIDANL